ncbi:MAG: hypothetical protein Q8861_02185 [Bacteroidota bacterium]|nr:hypothetical protein [Bacteroidota bacterium]
MTGKEVRNILKSNGFKLKDIALNLNITPQNLDEKLKVKDIKTNVLEEISSAINKNIDFFISTKEVVEESKPEYNKPKELTISSDIQILLRMLDKQEKETERLNSENERLTQENIRLNSQLDQLYREKREAEKKSVQEGDVSVAGVG